MGIGQQIIRLYSDIFKNIDLNKTYSVCELGRQNLVITKNIDEDFKNLYSLFNKTPNHEVMQLSPKDNWGIRAKNLYESLGFNYTSIDIDNEEKNEDPNSNIIMDLNFDYLENAHFNKFDLVTNYGTSEHLLNQLNFFKTMHDLTNKNGLMIHELPCMFGINHGMFKYEPKFFTDLARSNSYEILGFWSVLDPPSLELYKWDEKFEIENSKDMYIICVFKKTNENEFCVPLCANYEMKIKNSVLKRYKYNVEGKIINGDKTTSILRNKNDLAHLKKEILFNEIKNRILTKLRLR